MDAYVAAAKTFVSLDVNTETRAAAEALLNAGDAAALKSAFGGRLEFGTAGLRGPMGAGTNRMNDLTVLQAAQGLVAYLLETFGEHAQTQGVVLGFDHRARGSLNSRRFAVLTAVACVAKGVRVHLMDRLVCTPMVPFAILRLGAVAGIMVTASHNPKEDNGYKVYWGNGSQIISPHDKNISRLIDANAVPWPECRAAYEAGDEAALRANPLVTDPTDAMVEAYLAAGESRLCRHKAANGDAGQARVGVTYTAMHGVGLPFATAMFERFGLPAFAQTAEQVQPDPEFPTVAFPNPEEGKGALALAMATADRSGCTLILANDPDADRLAVAEWVPASEPARARPRQAVDKGEWRVFTGNEIGALLAHWQWTCHVAAGGTPAGVVMIASTVSSKMLASMAEKEGFTFQETLTGFKWMGNAMAEHAAAGRTVLFSFEEAIGFCCGDVVRDKDGVTAAAVFAEMANALARAGTTVSGHLDAISARYGHHVSNNKYVFVDDPAKTEAIFARLRNEGHYWARVGDLAIRAIRDLTGKGWDSDAPDGRPSLPTSSGTHMLTYRFSNGAVATLRTSGTEPKLKWYSELRGTDPVAAKRELARTVGLILDEMLRPEVHGLKRPAAE